MNRRTLRGESVAGMRRCRRSGGRLAILALAAGLCACAPEVTTNGHVLDPAALARIVPGKTSRQEVLQLLGSPSSVTSFDDNTWYYVNQRTETRSFYQTDLVAQDVLSITFDDTDRVTSMGRHGMEQAAAIEPVDRTTPTAGKAPSILEQLIGNVGRFGGAPPADAGPGGD